MRHQRHLPGRFELTDKGKVVAVALGSKVADCEPLEPPQERIALECRHHLVRRLLDSGAAAGAEMGDSVHGIEDALRLILAAEHRHGDRAANIGRVKPGMNRVLARDDAADRNGPGRRSGRAGIRHHGAGHDGRHPHQGIHVLSHGRDIGALLVARSLDQHRERNAISSHQRFDWLYSLEGCEDLIIVSATGTHGVGSRQGLLKPAPLPKTPGDQRVAVNHDLLSHFRSDHFCRGLQQPRSFLVKGHRSVVVQKDPKFAHKFAKEANFGFGTLGGERPFGFLRQAVAARRYITSVRNTYFRPATTGSPRCMIG
jgi:hypothetical protein